MTRQIVRDYYRIEIPADYSEDPAERAAAAFGEAAERARLYCIPCQWTVIKDDGNTLTIRRTRYQTRKDN